MRAILKRELIVTLRKWWLLALLVLVWAFYAVGITQMVADGDWASIGPVFPFLAHLTASLLLPGLAGVTLAAERHNDTLTLLRATPIRPLGILVAKLVAVLMPPFLFVVSLMPLAAISVYFRFSEPESLLFALVIVGSTALMLAALGLLCSAVARTVLSAVVGSYAGTVALIVILPYVIIRSADTYGVYIDESPALLGSSSFAILVFFLVADPALRLMGDTPVYICLAWQTALTCLCLFTTWRLLQRVDEATPRGPKAKGRTKKQTVRETRPRRPIPDRMNPILAKDLVYGGYLRFRWVVGFPLVICAALGGWGVAIISVDEFYDFETPLVLLPVTLLLFAPGFAAGGWLREARGSTFEQLSMTSLPPGQVVLGKLIAVCFPVFTLTLGIVGAAAIPWGLSRLGIGEIAPGNLRSVTRYLVPTLTPRMIGIAAFTALALCAAISSQRPATSVLHAYGVAVAIVLLFLAPIFGQASLPYSEETLSQLISVIPGALFVEPDTVIIAASSATNTIYLVLAFFFLRHQFSRFMTGKRSP